MEQSYWSLGPPGDVLITAELARRPHREPDYKAESRAWAALAKKMASRPDQALQSVAELAMQLCNADSAAIGFLESAQENGTLGWHAAAGALASNLQRTMPAVPSACQIAVQRNEVLLFRGADGFFPALRGAAPRIYENLLAPWTIDGEPAAVLWVVHHTPDGHFDSEDARRLTSLSRFASATYEMVPALQSAHHSHLEPEGNSRERTHELRESEGKYRTLFTAMEQGLCIIEKIQTPAGVPSDFRYTAANPAFERHTGLRAPVGKTIRQLVPDAEGSVIERYDRVVQTGEPEQFEAYISALDLWMEAEAFPAQTPGQIAVLFSNVSDRKRLELAMRASEERQAFLLKLSDALRSLEDPQDVKVAATRLLGQQLGVNRVFYADADHDSWLVTKGYEQGVDLLPDEPYAMADYGLWIIEGFRAGRRLHVRNVQTDDRFQPSERAALQLLQIGAAAGVPLVKAGALVAMLTLHSNAPRDWTEQDFALIEDVAERTWAAVERARAEAALRDSEAKLALELADTNQLQRISGSFILDDDIDALYDKILDVARALMRSDMASIQRLSPERQELFLLAQQGFAPESARFWEWVQANDTTSCGLALARGEPVIVPDVDVWEFVAGTEDLMHYRLSGIRATLSTPLVSRDGLIVGVISTHWRDVHHPSERELRLLDVLARQASDLIERRTAEAAIRESQEKYRTLFNSIDEGFILCEVIFDQNDKPVDIRYLDANPAAVRMTGRELVGKTTREIDPNFEPHWFEVFGRVAKTGLSERHELLAAPLGTVYHIHIFKVGEHRVAALYEDVRERKQAEDALRESEEQFRRALQEAPIPIIMHAEDGQVLQISRRWTQLTGFQREDIPTFEAWLTHAYGKGADTVRKHMRDLFGGTKPSADIELPVRMRTGEQRYWSFSASSPGTLRDGRRFIVGMAIDITERKHAEAALSESEQRFRLYVQNVREYALLQTDVEGRLTSWNPGAERLFGFTKDEVMGLGFAQVTGTEDEQVKTLQEEISRVSHGVREEDAQWLKRKDGSKFWARWVSEPIYDDAGGLLGLAKVMRDETEREAAQADLRKSLSEKEELLKEVHHRVKNNLQVITSLLNLQARQIKEPAALTLFEESRNRVQSIASIHELLYRSESFATIKLSVYARQIVHDLVNFYGLGERIHVEIIGDGAALELERAVPYGLLLNELVSNACKYAFVGGRSGKIAIRFDRREGDIELTMADDGPGLPPDFDYRRTTSLGLQLVRNLTRQLRGSFEISSHGGTTVRILFPDASAVAEKTN